MGTKRNLLRGLVLLALLAAIFVLGIQIGKGMAEPQASPDAQAQ